MIDFILHLDKHVTDLVRDYGAWAYSILFAIIFAETGFVIFPFLPGDSLLFVVGIFSVQPGGAFNVWLLFLVLASAAIIGDQVNYQVGKFLGARMFKNENAKILKPSHLRTTQEFYAKHGSKTVMLARFVPVVRALAPFVAGMSAMPWRIFTAWSVAGAVLWVGVCVFAGHLFGNIPQVKEHFEYGLLVIIAFSILPGIIEYMRHLKRKKSESNSGA